MQIRVCSNQFGRYRKMKKLWVGYLLMMLSTNIILCISPFENSQLVLFPPFIGYIVMAVAYHKLKKEDPVFGRNGAGVTAIAILMILRFVSDGSDPSRLCFCSGCEID